jgi:hypothetical protein
VRESGHSVPVVTKFLLSLHVLAAIIAIGPVTVAASMFPAVARRRSTAPARPDAYGPISRGPASSGSAASGSARSEPVSSGSAGSGPVSSGSAAPGPAVSGPGSSGPGSSGPGSSGPGSRGPVSPGFAEGEAGEQLRVLHRICRVYGLVGVAVPVFGLATASSLGVLGDAWLITSIVLTAAAALILGLLIIPGQARVLTGEVNSRLGMVTGIFNLLWATVTVLMIVRPGSTTGA